MLAVQGGSRDPPSARAGGSGRAWVHPVKVRIDAIGGFLQCLKMDRGEVCQAEKIARPQDYECADTRAAMQQRPRDGA